MGVYWDGMGVYWDEMGKEPGSEWETYWDQTGGQAVIILGLCWDQWGRYWGGVGIHCGQTRRRTGVNWGILGYTGAASGPAHGI